MQSVCSCQSGTYCHIHTSRQHSFGIGSGITGSPFVDVQQSRQVSIGHKRSIDTDLRRPQAKRLKSSVVTSETESRALALQAAQEAAATIPPRYHVNNVGESSSHLHSSRAIDCWALTAGTTSRAQPSPSAMEELRCADEARTKQFPLDLKKLDDLILRCTECP